MKRATGRGTDLMSGIRLLHATGRNCVVTIEHPYRPLPSPQLCPTCQVLHPRKTYHLWLDDSGGTVVSLGVFEALKQCGLPNLAIEAEVERPPSATISLQDGKRPTVVREKPRIRLYTSQGV